MVPFVDGWVTSPIWAGGSLDEPGPNFNLCFKGKNLTEEYIRNLDMYSVIAGFRTDISVMLLRQTVDGFVAEMLFEDTLTEGNTYEFVIGETVSGTMALEGGKLV